MSTTTKEQGHSLRIERQFSADAETIFDAWTDAESMKKWMCPGPGMTTPTAELDVRVGGEYSLVMASPDAEYAHHGTYLEVDPPRRLSFTWISPGTEGRSSVVTVELEPNADGTLLKLSHDRLPSEGSAQNHEGGWGNILETLENHLK